MKFQTPNPWHELQSKIDFLMRKESYPEKPSSIESVETHMSWVFITERHAYKLKKPIHNIFVNLESVEERRKNAENEVRLNQDLAPGIYLDVIPLFSSVERGIHFNGNTPGATIVDWLVLMKRFPRHLTIDYIIQNNGNGKELRMHDAAKLLTQFYKKSRPVELSPHDYKARLDRYVRENFKDLAQKKYGLDYGQLKSIYEAQLEALSSLSQTFETRVLHGKIIEAHGDLRPEHVCLTRFPIIVDRLEFNLELRTLDPVDELSYFHLECTFLGRPDIGDLFFSVYENMTEDLAEEKLKEFYKSLRAMMRTKISAWHLDDERVLNKEKFQIRARSYLNLASTILK